MNCFESKLWLYLKENPLLVPGLGPAPFYATMDISEAPITVIVKGPEETITVVKALSLEEETTKTQDAMMKAEVLANIGSNDSIPIIESNNSIEVAGVAAVMA